MNPAPKKKLPEGYDPSKKAEREKFMQELFASGEISNGVGKVVVNKSFYQWTFEQKKIFAGVAYAWCLDVDPGCNLVVFKNQYTDKEVARFSAITGFEVK